MALGPRYCDVLDAADNLTEEEQQELIDVLKKRLLDAARQRLIENVREAEAEFAAGSCKPMTVDEIMNEIR